MTTFRLDQLSHIKLIKYGFKFYLVQDATNAVARFRNAHISGKYSGEVHVETVDRERVINVLASLGIPRR